LKIRTLKIENVKNILFSFGRRFWNAHACLRILIVVFFFLLSFGFPAFAEVTSVPGTVTGDNVNMRISPALRSEVVGQLERGQEVEILLTDGEWCAIIPPMKISAWVSEQYVKDGLVTGRRVNVRSGPGISYGRLTYLREGTALTVLEEKGGWVKITLPDTGRLWVSSRYIAQTPIGTAPESGETVRVVSSSGVQGDSPPGSREIIVITVSTPLPVPSPPPARSVTSSQSGPSSARTIPSSRTVPSALAKSYIGYIEKLGQPISIADREYAYKLLKNRFDSRPIAFLSGDTIDLKKYLSRKVRLWAIVIEKRDGHPDLMEVKGAGMLW
jgi:uncharacterized protein YraI